MTVLSVSMASSILYDGSSMLYMAKGGTPPDPSVSAISLGNGKIAVVPTMTTIDSAQSMITGRVQVDRGRYDSGAIRNFQFNRVRAFGDADEAVTYTISSASLSMDTSTFTLDLSAASSSTAHALGTVLVNMYAHSTLPFCFMQTVTLQLSAAYMNGLNGDPYILHDLYCDQTISRVKFNTSVLHVPSLSAPLYLLVGEGQTDNGSGTSSETPRSVAVGCCYLFEDSAAMVPQGYNVYANDRRRAYSRINLPKAAAGKGSFRFHILTATMSSDDFQNPEEEVKRILLSVSASRSLPGQGPIDIANKLRADHVFSWSTQWSNSITIIPKTMATAKEKSDVMAVQRASRFALYNLLSSTRAGARVTSDPSLLSLMDSDGSLLYRGDAWFMPVLLLLRPECAKSVLEYRRKTLESAANLAQCYGYSGTKYGFTEDVIGYSSAVYFDSSQPQHLYNTSLVAISVWNQYRSTSDTTWLQQIGYEILRGVADFLVSAATANVSGNGQYSFINILGYGSVPATDNTFTVATAKLALSYAIQASYVLTYQVRQSWYDVLNGLALPTDSSATVLVTDASYEGPTPSTTIPPIIDCLIPLLPWYYNSVFPHTCSCAGNTNVASTIAANIAAYLPPVQTAIQNGTAHPYTVAVLSGLSAVTSQAGGRNADAAVFLSLLTSFIKSSTDAGTGWGNFVDTTRPRSSAMDYPVSDLNLASMLLFVLLNCVAGIQVRGLVTDTRYFAEECKIRASDNAILPVTWASLTISRVGTDFSEVRVVNQQVYSSV